MTLVLDLDETLIHFESAEKKFKLRPGCLTFIKEMSSLFEIVIFTAAAKDYADFILNIIEKRLREGAAGGNACENNDENKENIVVNSDNKKS